MSDPPGRCVLRSRISRIEQPQVFLTSGNFSLLAGVHHREMSNLRLAIELHSLLVAFILAVERNTIRVE